MQTTSKIAAERMARFRFIILIVVISGLAVCALLAHSRGWLTPEGIRDLVDGYGYLSPLVYYVVSSLLIVAWVPRSLLSIVAGALFGVWWGSILALMMGATGSIGGYFLGFKLGQPYVSLKATGKKAQKTLAFVRKRGFWAIVTCRICPFVPSELISVSSGSTGIPLPSFIVASILGMAPGAFLYAALGSSLFDPEARWLGWVSIGGFGLLALITGYFLVDLWKRDSRETRS